MDKNERITTMQNKIGDLEDAFVVYFLEDVNTKWNDYQEQIIENIEHSIQALQANIIELEESCNS